MNFRTILILLIISIKCLTSFSQSENWYFGENAGLKFTEGNVEVVSDGSISTKEGCSTISNENGKLLFYTDGITVWNSNHDRMDNGYGLYGHPSSTQSGVIVRNPGDQNLYYIFTIAEKNDPYGLRYSIVDITQNSGLGKVIQKNTLIVNNTYEKIAAVRHCDSSGIWLIVHDWNSSNFMSYLISEAGLALTPIISSVGIAHNGGVANRPGYMKSSTQGDRIAMAINGPLNTIEVFDFDNNTGIISNPITISSTEYRYAYGLEFSTNGRFLYVTKRFAPSKIYQFDLDSETNNDVVSSATVIASDPAELVYAALQLGIDGKIYVAKSGYGYLGVINDPNLKGTSSNFVDDAIYLNGNKSQLGLPTFIQNYFGEVDLGDDLILCAGSEITLDATVQNASSYRWQDNSHNSQLRVSTSGIYWVDVVVNGCTQRDSVVVTGNDVPNVDLGEDRFICVGEKINLEFNLDDVSYLWSDGSANTSFEISSGGQYWVEATNECGTVKSEITIATKELPKLNIESDYVMCFNETILIDLDNNDWSYKWSDGSEDGNFYISSEGKYWVDASNDCGVIRKEFEVEKKQPPIVDLGNDLLTCVGEPIILSPEKISDNNYLWSTGELSSTIQVIEEGLYWLEASNNCGVFRDTIQVSTILAKEVFIPNVITPNGDEKNDVFEMDTAINNSSIVIFNRWGNEVYVNSNYIGDWDAGKLSAGVYYYAIIDECTQEEYKGWVQVLK
jgi:gliding motility-associated-like protein